VAARCKRGESEESKPHEEPRHGWEDNIKTDLEGDKYKEDYF
jgi:hypothetical protein